MSVWHYLRSLWRNVRHRDRVDLDLDHEIRSTFEMLVEEKQRAGVRVVLKPLPVDQPDRLVLGSFGMPGRNYNYSLPYPQFERIRQQSKTLESVFAIYPFGLVTAAHHGNAAIADGLHVTGDYYRTLRLTPAVGRLIRATDDVPGHTVAVLSYRTGSAAPAAAPTSSDNRSR